MKKQADGTNFLIDQCNQAENLIYHLERKTFMLQMVAGASGVRGLCVKTVVLMIKATVHDNATIPHLKMEVQAAQAKA